LRNLHTAFHSNGTNFPPAVCKSLFTTSLWSFVAVWILDDSHSDWGEMKLNIVLICVSLMARNIEHFFMYLLVICTSFDNFLFTSFAHLLLGLLVLLEFSFLNSLNILVINPLSDV
jgi:hypothetical protein